ncbi:TIGR01212 family radical SAM protein [Carboxylicivirga sediminis]|uniref:TIGR01212 family radical SAM protein n=1 Tax=Carboxylicivirga sediminis TaxID=2006564 RepID=A0A941F9V5_9BACT|nr:TIGR01212 family radical SAM protein [Carboxylicivirga sediminis]MBR8537700.1 TIGR01212 family radical SAM protein [Carboxylicivirga sediminis]
MQYDWGTSKRYNDYSSYIKRTFGERVQKVSVNAGFTCPNRDGSKGTGGCAFCNNSTFNPSYCGPELSIVEQIDKGISFFRPKYQTQQYLAYFQAYSNTYGETAYLLEQYQQALNHPKVAGIVLGTRPDCISDDLLVTLKEWRKDYYIAIELGAESTSDETLLQINRGHNYAETVDAAKRIAGAGIPVGMHLILGLPGENREQLLQHAREVSQLPISFLKLHQLQIVKGSSFAKIYETTPDFFRLYTAEEFIDLVVDFLEIMHPRIVMDRFISQAPHDLLIAPRWGLKNFEFVAKVEKRLAEKDSWQGKYFQL